MRFDLIDQVIEMTDDHIVASKNVTNAEEYLQDHFPSFPVLPGVMMLETMVQAARKLMDAQPEPPTMPLIIKDVRNLRYGNMVRPGQTLVVKVQLRKVNDDGTLNFEGTGKVGDQVAVQGRFILVQSPALEGVVSEST